MLPYLISHDYVGFLIVGIVLIIAISLHEFGHAVADEMEGDPTARLAGRLTINPRNHLDPFGTLMIALVGFGWGKPCPISPANMRNRRFGSAIVGFAGPLVNALLAVATAVVARALRIQLVSGFGAPGIPVTERLVSGFLYINVVLALLNLIPIPPLDGSRILGAILPPDKQRFVFFMDKWGFLILLLLAFFVLPSFLGRLATSAEIHLLQLVGYPVA